MSRSTCTCPERSELHVVGHPNINNFYQTAKRFVDFGQLCIATAEALQARHNLYPSPCSWKIISHLHVLMRKGLLDAPIWLRLFLQSSERNALSLR